MIEVKANYTYPNGNRVKLDFQAKEGEKVFLAGKTGSGKSTLLRVLNGLIPELYGGKLEGKVSVYGRNGNNEDVFLVTQHPEEQLLCESVVEEVAFPLVQSGFDWKDAKTMAEDVLHSFGLDHLTDRKTSELSDGEKQSVIVCCAIASECKCLAFDEPFAHLHPALAERIVRRILSERRTVILSEHRVELSEGFDRVAGDFDFDFEVKFDFEVNIRSNSIRKVLVRARDASIRRGNFSLDGLNFEIGEGETVALTGVNGSGKTTLLRAIAGFEKSRGIEVFGKTGFSFQYPGYNLSASRVVEEVPLKVLEKFGLRHLANRHPHSLSGGEKRIVSALKALRQKVVLLDEPTAGLDRNLRYSFMKNAVEVVRKEKKAMVVATHDEMTAEMCDWKIEL